jgi:hypothetical protein
MDYENCSEGNVWAVAVVVSDYLLLNIRARDDRAESYRKKIDVIREWSILIHPHLQTEAKQGRSADDIFYMIDYVFDENNYDVLAEFNWVTVITSMKKFVQHLATLASRCICKIHQERAELQDMYQNKSQ